MPVSNVILIPAAGASSRLGQPKQLVEFDGSPLIRRACEIALDVLPDVVVVTGAEAPSVGKALGGLPVRMVHNEDWQQGMGRSISVGVESLLDQYPDTERVLVFLCDLPTINASHLNALIEKHVSEGLDIVCTRYSDTYGVPAVFGPKYFEDLLVLDGDQGARHLLVGKDDGKRAYVDFPGRFVDIDLPNDLAES